MAQQRSGRRIEIVTAVMLGLVSVVTALGTWQASVWNDIAEEFGDDSSDARDVSVSQSVLADYEQRIDQQVSLEAARIEALKGSGDSNLDLLYDIRISTQLGRATPGFQEAWRAWADADFDPALNPALDPDYLVARESVPDSYAYASRLLGEAGSTVKARSGIFAQAALVQALALFLFGISTVNRLRPVRAGVLGLGITVFLSGLVLATTAY